MSASDRGPSSGTEKCSRLLTLLATFSAAAITEPAAARTPDAIWEQISAPQRYAEEAIEPSELKLLLILATPEETVLRRPDIAEDTVDLMLLKAEVVVDFSVFQPLVTVLRTADTEEVVRDLILLHAVVMTVLIPFQLVFVRVFTAFHALVIDVLTEAVAEVVSDLIPFHAVVITLLIPFQLVIVSDFTAFQALVIDVFTAAVAEVTLVFTAAKLVWVVVLMLFHVLVVLAVMELHADLIAALTPAVPVLTVWLMAAQLLLYACSTPLMELVMEVDSVVDRFSAAAVTRLVLVVIPFASPCMKSGIQLSISANGPSSGTEKCRKERIRSATPDTALATS